MRDRKLKIGKKGMELISMGVVFLIGSLTLEGLFITAMIVNTHVVRRAIRESDAIEVIDAMEFFKEFIGGSVDYASQRAVFDVMKRGGQYSMPEDVKSSNCQPYWKIYDESINTNYLSDSVVEKNIENMIMDVFECYDNEYSKGYSESEIVFTLPSYSECGNVDIVNTGGKKFDVIILSNCENGLEVSRDFISVKEKNANFEGEIKINIFELIDKSKAEFIDKRPIYDAVIEALSDADCRSLSDIEKDSCSYTGGNDNVGSDLLMLECSNWENRLRNTINSKLNDIEIDGTELSFSISRMGADYEVTGCSQVCNKLEPEKTGKYECQESRENVETENGNSQSNVGINLSPTDRVLFQGCQPTNSCDTKECKDGDVWCKNDCDEWEYKSDECGSKQCYQGSCCEPETCSSLGHSCGTWDDGCGGTINCGTCGEGEECSEKVIERFKTICSYSYSADVDVLVKVKSDSNLKYPIYDSTSKILEEKKPSLEFRIIDGNIGSLTADIEETCSETDYC